MSGREMLENAVFIRVCVMFGILTNYRKFTSFIAKMGYGWGTIYLKMGYEN